MPNMRSPSISGISLNKAITTEKKVINAVAKINGFEKLAGRLNTNVLM
jgi:hypothetical protein